MRISLFAFRLVFLIFFVSCQLIFGDEYYACRMPFDLSFCKPNASFICYQVKCNPGVLQSQYLKWGIILTNEFEMMESTRLIAFKKAFGKQDYQIYNNDYKKTLLTHPLVNGLFTVGNSFVLIANTQNWNIELVTGNTMALTGYTREKIMDLNEKFIMAYSVAEHVPMNMATVKACMEYSNACPENQRNYIFAVYFYNAVKKDGSILTVQHQSIPLIFDENKVPYIFCNIYSDISHLNAQNIPQGMMINKFTEEVFHVNAENAELEKRNELFSEREKDVIRGLRNGKSSREIADELHLSYETVRTHRKNILKKAGVSNTSSLVNFSLLYNV